jgi:hypothetical protein
MRRQNNAHKSYSEFYELIRTMESRERISKAAAHFINCLSKEGKFNWKAGIKSLKWICLGSLGELCEESKNAKNISMMCGERDLNRPKGLRIINRPKYLRKMPTKRETLTPLLLKRKMFWGFHSLRFDMHDLIQKITCRSRSWSSPNQVQVRPKYKYRKFTKFE